MKGNQCVIRWAQLIADIAKGSEQDEFELEKHAFLEDVWCITSPKTRRSIQVNKSDPFVPEISYMLNGVGEQKMAVFDVERVAVRVLQYLRGETEQV